MKAKFSHPSRKKLLGISLGLGFSLFALLLSPSSQDLNLRPVDKEVKVAMPPIPFPVNIGEEKPPELSARSIVVVDAHTGRIIYAKNEGLKLFPASTTKIMTAVIALENYSPEEIFTVGKIKKNGQAIGLLPGEKITVKNLLYGLLVASGNDAAQVLADNFPGQDGNFVAAMNRKAQELGLTNTHFENPAGLDHSEHYSTALSLAKLSLYALKNPLFAEIVATPKITIFDIRGKISHKLTNLNELVGKESGVLGVKTGWTQEAGECLVTYFREAKSSSAYSREAGSSSAYFREDQKEIITVLLGSDDRFGETKKLLGWVLKNFSWPEPTP